MEAMFFSELLQYAEDILHNYTHNENLQQKVLNELEKAFDRLQDQLEETE